MNDTLITAKQASQLVGLSINTIKKHINLGTVPSIIDVKKIRTYHLKKSDAWKLRELYLELSRAPRKRGRRPTWVG